MGNFKDKNLIKETSGFAPAQPAVKGSIHAGQRATYHGTPDAAQIKMAHRATQQPPPRLPKQEFDTAAYLERAKQPSALRRHLQLKKQQP